jgi:hypothetical protein
MVNFKFAKFHCYQQTQSFLITPYYNHGRKKRNAKKRPKKIWVLLFGRFSTVQDKTHLQEPNKL